MLFLLDSDVVIDALRRHADACGFLLKYPQFLAISVLTISEVRAGLIAKEEARFSELIKNTFTFDVTPEIALQGGRFCQQYRKSHNSGLVDCIIAATAEVHKATLVTLNKKHYPMLKKVVVPYKKA